MPVKTYIHLGRYGDLCTLLPLLYADFKRGEKQTLLVAKEFAGLLDGVSYVNPVVFDGHHGQIGLAVEQAKTLGQPWVCTQINGPVEACREFVWKPAGATANNCPSFDMEIYRMCGRLKEWNDDLHLVFDRRNKERESALIAKVLTPVKGRPKKLMLVHAEGVSSPFPYKKLLFGLLDLKFSKQYRIVDLGKVQAERFFDLIGLYEKAHVLVAVDSGPLHLAKACPALPVVALTNDKPMLWNGSHWMPQHIAYCRYSDFPERCFELVDIIEKRDDATLSSLVVAWNQYESNPALPMTGSRLGVQIGSCGRDSHNTIKDTERHPYLKDVIKMGLKRCSSKDSRLIITRPKTSVNPLASVEPCYAYRMNRNGEGDTFQPVIDLLCAKKSFWLEHMKDIPDLIMGNDHYWGNVLWAMFKKYGAVDVTGCCWRKTE